MLKNYNILLYLCLKFKVIQCLICTTMDMKPSEFIHTIWCYDYYLGGYETYDARGETLRIQLGFKNRSIK